jgi:hypothetical protein
MRRIWLTALTQTTIPHQSDRIYDPSFHLFFHNNCASPFQSWLTFAVGEPVDGIPPAVSFARSRASQKQLDPPTRLTRIFNLSLHHRLQGANTRRRRVTPMQSIPPSIRGTRGTSTSLEIPLSLLLLTFSLFLFLITHASPYEISRRSRD